MNMKKTTITLFALIVAIMAMADADVPFSLNGLETDDHVTVTISSESYLKTMDISANGDYTFKDVPTGTHAIKVEAIGYNLPDSKKVNVKEDGTIEPFTGIKLVITKMDEDDNKWTHSWHEDGSVSGYTTTAYVNKPSVIEYLGKKIVPADVPSQSILESSYHIILSNEGVIWTQEYAYRLLETMKMFPQHIITGDTLIISLTDEHITDDILMEDYNGGKLVTIATDAFAYANPFLVNLDGVRGRFFSKRLHHAVVNMVTNYGTDKGRADNILQYRFGCSIYPPSYEELTRGTTDEDAGCFQEFVARELVEIINMFEEMPEGFHKIPHLNYLIRRQNGHLHPLYPDAAAVTWCVDNGYIEFMEKAFNGDQLFETQRLIIHEKTHMLWGFVFSDEIKNDWIELGGWYKDPNTSSGWATTKDTEFVSAYAHDVNPNEDMAESVAFYIKNPDKLMSRSLPKYEFIRDRIMHGTRYISKIRDDLTFEVLNLFPDYDYPGKIKSLDLQVLGKPEEDKTVVIDITLNHMEGFEDGAAAAILRMSSPWYFNPDGEIIDQYVDMWLFPVNGDEHHLQGEAYINKYSKAGYWTCGNITVRDLQMNERFEGSHDFVWNMYVNNPLEDVYPPVYEKGSLRYELNDTIVDGHKEQVLTAYFKLTDNVGISDVANGWACDLSDTYSFGDSGDRGYNEVTQEGWAKMYITEFYPTANYYVTSIGARDPATTLMRVEFSDSPQHEPRKLIHVETPNPDTVAPELDQDRIFIYAEPTHPEAPDGETIVTINYYARDDKSGLSLVYYRLRDPQGIDHFAYHYHRNFYTKYFDGDPTVWERYTATIILPPGSAPGIWGLSELSLHDKAENWKTYNFVETVIFEPDDSAEDYILFAEMTEDDMLNFDLTAISGNTTGYSYVYRIISEESGEEITGIIDVNGESGNARIRRAPAGSGYNVDISSLPDGKIVVIVQVKDAEGEIVAVRSKSLIKNSYQLGDVNRDGKVNVTDAVVLVSHILGEYIDGFVLEAADLNNDSEVDVFDVTKIINIILTTGANSTKVRKAIGAQPYTAFEQLYVENSADGIMVNVNNVDRFTSFQMDVEVPEGVELTGAQLTVPETGHILRYTKVGENYYRILALSLNNTLLSATAEGLLKLDLSNGGEVQINDILFVTPQGEEVQMESLSGNIATDIADIETFPNTDVYDLLGRKLDVDLKQLPKGLYIINGKKVMVK